ncbi:MAG TPA: LacI family DNA-binding transcriptional regulator [Candidatus Binatia bacterium]|nr:LacI family DNA-binding transcriptional regulator [Candidatus Binatia bacterium]
MHEEPDVTVRATTRPGMREVAERAGVAMSSVSRVLSGHPDVSPQMRQVVMAAVRELGYQPDMLAQGLRRGKTYSVGFTVADIGNPILAEIVTGAEKRLRAAGYSLLLTNSEANPDLDVEHISLLERRRVDGLILSLAEEHHPGVVAALQQVSSPVVLVDRDIPDGVKARRAAFDHVLGMRAAAEHLLQLGHRRFALIIGGPERPARERRRAVEEALAAVPEAELKVYPGEFSVEHGRRASRTILEQGPRPTAIIAGGNMLMEGALLTLKEAGVEVGRDVSFVGCDDVIVAEIHQPQIAVVRRDIRAVGEAAAELLLADLEPENGNAEAPNEIVLPTEFVARPSCAPPPK